MQEGSQALPGRNLQDILVFGQKEPKQFFNAMEENDIACLIFYVLKL